LPPIFQAQRDTRQRGGKEIYEGDEWRADEDDERVRCVVDGLLCAGATAEGVSFYGCQLLMFSLAWRRHDGARRMMPAGCLRHATPLQPPLNAALFHAVFTSLFFFFSPFAISSICVQQAVIPSTIPTGRYLPLAAAAAAIHRYHDMFEALLYMR